MNVPADRDRGSVDEQGGTGTGKLLQGSPKKMLEFAEARQRIIETVLPLPVESVAEDEWLGRVVAADIHSSINLPVADNSSMDGYAVRAEDLVGASAESPVTLKLSGTVPAGTAPEVSVERGTCVRLYTGSFLPQGADAVIMQEDTSPSDEGETIACHDTVKPWENVRFRGEDVKAGSCLMKRGQRIQTRHLGMLAATGQTSLKTAARPRVAILATGQELQQPGEELKPGAIYESNRVVIASLVRDLGGVPHIYPLVADELSATTDALRRAATDNDVIVTTGGVSVGDFDLIRPAIEALQGTIHFWRVRLRPGKPFVFGEISGSPLFGLPGNPVSAVTTFMVLVRPALLKMQGASDLNPATRRMQLGEPLSNNGDRPHYVRVQWDQEGNVSSSGLQGSHALQSLAKADGWLRLEPGQSLGVGDPVEVILWDDSF